MINKFSNEPLYSQLKNVILKKIENGDYPEDSKIPSEQELCEQYNISRPTVRQAITELTNNGYLYKEKGKGTFVSKAKSNIDIRNYTGFTDSILDSQVPGQRNFVSMSTINSTKVSRLDEIFGISAGQKVEFAEVKYLSSYGQDIYSLNISYIPLNIFPSIIEDIQEKKPSYDILRGKYPYLPVKSKSALEIVFTDTQDAQLLQVQSGQPLIRIENILYSKSGQAVEYIITKYRADKCKLMFEHTK